MAIGICCSIGMAIATMVALLKIVARPKNILLAVGYLLISVIMALLAWGGFWGAGWVGNKTRCSGQAGLLVGAIFPGIMALAIIPKFIAIAIQQTSEITVE